MRRDFLVALTQDQRPHATADRIPLLALKQTALACLLGELYRRAAGAPAQAAAPAANAWTIWPASPSGTSTSSRPYTSTTSGAYPRASEAAALTQRRLEPQLQLGILQVLALGERRPDHLGGLHLKATGLERLRQLERDHGASARVSAQRPCLLQMLDGCRVCAVLLCDPKLAQHLDAPVVSAASSASARRR